MAVSLTRDQRKLLSDITLEAREVAEKAARAALENLAVHEHEYRGHMTVDQRQLRNRLRARGRALGDRLNQHSGTQTIDHLAESAAYEHWHRLLFTRFLAENHLLHTDEALGALPVSLDECDELAAELGARDGFDLACRFASQTLPGIFRRDDPVLDLRLARNHEVQLRQLLGRLAAELFRADDALGWTYQFWQAKRKEEVNKGGGKIGADELPAVTQLFTEDYMVEFLLHNTLGAWWAGKCGPIQAEIEEQARSAVSLRAKEDMPDIAWNYLRFVRDDEGSWSPAAGTFDGWPKHAAEIRFLDPCMGSGHFLVFALPILARLRMEEEGLSAAEAVAAVLRDNLHGLEIDERCTQIAAFNVALTAWRLGGYHALPSLHLACSGLAPQAKLADWLRLAGDNDKRRVGMEQLYRLFSQAPVLGSLINPRLQGDLIEDSFNELKPLLVRAFADERADEGTREIAVTAQGITKAAELLSRTYTLVATNVPYLGRGKQQDALRDYCDRNHSESKADLATCFIERSTRLCPLGTVALVAPQNWLFLPGYKQIRERMLRESQFNAVVRLGANAFQDMNFWAATTALTIVTRSRSPSEHKVFGLDATGSKEHSFKKRVLSTQVDHTMSFINQSSQLANPDFRISMEEPSPFPLLRKLAQTPQGMKTGDDPRFRRNWWEIAQLDERWRCYHGAPDQTRYIDGASYAIDFSNGEAAFARPQGQSVWGTNGIVIKLMGGITCARYFGAVFDSNVTALVPRSPAYIPALWVYVSSPDFEEALRAIEQSVKVNNATVAKVPFNLDYWQKVAAEKYPNGLPEPHSDDPTQWLFNGHPKCSEQPLQVAVARLLGYRWPRQTGSEFPDCPALGTDGLEGYVDADGIVCLPPINKEQPAAARLRNLLAAAFEPDWSPSRERDLLAATGARQTNLEDWLRDAFFEQHCKLFKNRPFIWHIWDGRKDGFHALVNYHRLDHATLQKLTYSYLGDWIRQQDADAKADKPGAAERLGAAQALEAELIEILEGEPPCDIFIRWKPIREQPLGWQPDLNDGVRLNIRPFMNANDVGRKGAGILRFKPNIKWDKDRGKEPYRDKADYPWFWHTEEPPLSCPGGPDFTGHRWNNVHLTLARKRAERNNGG